MRRKRATNFLGATVVSRVSRDYGNFPKVLSQSSCLEFHRLHGIVFCFPSHFLGISEIGLFEIRD